MKKFRSPLILVLASVFVFGGGLANAQHMLESCPHAQMHMSKDTHMKMKQSAPNPHSKAAAHGGVVTMTKEFHFETVFSPKETRLYVYDIKGNPSPIHRGKTSLVAGTVEILFSDPVRSPIKATFKKAAEQPDKSKPEHSAGNHAGATGKHPSMEASGGHHAMGMDMTKEEHSGSASPVLWSCPMHPEAIARKKEKCPQCGMNLVAQEYLTAETDLAGVKLDDAKALITLTKLSGKKEKDAVFTAAVRFARPSSAMCQAPHKADNTAGDHHGHGDPEGKPCAGCGMDTKAE